MIPDPVRCSTAAVHPLAANPRAAHRLAGIVLAAAYALLTLLLAAPSEASEKAAPAARMRTFLEEQEVRGFRGVAVVSLSGEILLQEGYGLADPEKGSKVTPEMVFDIGSITKQLTAAAVLKLELEGKLRVSDRIGRHLPAVPQDKAGITLHHLLTHTAGLAGNLGGDYEPIERDDYVRLCLETPLQHGVGERFAYSNTGYSLLAAIVERVSGESWEAFTRKHLFAPAGLERTGYEMPPGTATALLDPERSPHPSPLDRPAPSWHLLGNGGVLSTGADLFRWHRALLGDEILPAAAREKLFAPHVRWTGREGVAYGYGWEVATTVRGTRVVRHNGGSGEGVNATFQRFLDEKAMIAVLSHRFLDGKPVIFTVARGLERILLGEPPEEATAAEPGDSP